MPRYKLVLLDCGGFSRGLYQGTASAVPEGHNVIRAFKPCKGVNELQFQIKGQDYFLAFIEDEKRWYVIVPTPEGVHRIPMYVDAVKWGTPVSLGTETTLSS